MSILGKILGSAVAPAVDYFKARQEFKHKERVRQMELDDAKHIRELEKLKLNLTADHDWEMEFARQAANSWKDEWELILISIPLVMCWIPGLQDEALTGFEVLDKTPVWFQGLVLTIFLANYGIRKWRRKIPGNN